MVRARDSRRWVGSSWSGRGRRSGRSSDQRGSRRAVLEGAGKGAGLDWSCRTMPALPSTAVRVMTSGLLVDRARAVTSGTASPRHAARQDHPGHMVTDSRAAVTRYTLVEEVYGWLL